MGEDMWEEWEEESDSGSDDDDEEEEEGGVGSSHQESSISSSSDDDFLELPLNDMTISAARRWEETIGRTLKNRREKETSEQLQNFLDAYRDRSAVMGLNFRSFHSSSSFRTPHGIIVNGRNHTFLESSVNPFEILKMYLGFW